VRAKARIATSIDRLKAVTLATVSRFGMAFRTASTLRPGVSVYLAKVGQAVVLHLCGGDKRTGRRHDKAVDYWPTSKEGGHDEPRPRSVSMTKPCP
jgi:putative component of toxin-antitoxin plasmid stabilization module